MKHIVFAALLLGLFALNARGGSAQDVDAPKADGPAVAISFAQGQWNQDDWLFARSPRWEEHGRWIQEEEGIANALPEDVDPWAIPADRMADLYASLLYKRPFHGNVCFKTVCQFDQEMAPLLVFSKELTEVYREHLEVVLYNEGLNLWHHYFIDGRPSWRRIGFLEARFEPGKKYELSATFDFSPRGTTLIIECGGHRFGTMLDGDWPRDYYAGITACEGVNRFFSFSAEAAGK